MGANPGGLVFEQLVKDKELLNDEALERQLEIITSPILKAIPSNPYELEFHIIKDSQINAFAIPGGDIVLHTGLLTQAESPNEIAGVIAHEIAHITQKHSLRQLVGTAGIYLLTQSFFGDMSGLLAVLADNGAILLTRKFSREYEKEADETGFTYLVEASINPEGMIRFFEKLNSKHNSSAEKALNGSLNFLSTHPGTEERIDNLSEKLRHTVDHQKFFTFPFDLKEFQKRIDTLTSDSLKIGL